MIKKLVFLVLLLPLLIACSKDNDVIIEELLENYSNGHYSLVNELYEEKTKGLSKSKKLTFDEELSEILLQTIKEEEKKLSGSKKGLKELVSNFGVLSELGIENKEIDKVLDEHIETSKIKIDEINQSIKEMNEKKLVENEKARLKLINERVTFTTSVDDFNTNWQNFFDNDVVVISDKEIYESDDENKSDMYTFSHFGNDVLIEYDTNKSKFYSLTFSAQKPEVIEDSGIGGLDEFFEWTLNYFTTIKFISGAMRTDAQEAMNQYDGDIYELLLIAASPDGDIDQTVDIGDFTYNLYTIKDIIYFDIYSEKNKLIERELKRYSDPT